MQAQTSIENEARLGRGPYRRRSLTEKRKIVELCLRPGASVAGVALAHGVNANLVRKWIAKYRAGEWGELGATLLPVAVRREPQAPRLPAEAHPKGYIEIELAGARLRVVGRVETEALRAVLGALR
ncbi:IS66-like element accessory protein TnpA [Pelomicrobium sp. G1]|uniref:IS66-like element accessory protein TnpA n=1 Tax=unclassified Pelomicrobium TaxID=2815318 RepID=UPI003F776BE5